MLYTQEQLDEICNKCFDYRIQQKRPEWMAFLQLLNQTDKKYKNILEIGCYDGGTTIGFSYFTENLISVDIINPPRFSDYEIKRNCNFKYLPMSSFDPSTLVTVKHYIDSIDILFIDGDHNYEMAKKDYELYKDMVKPGGLIAFHDIADELAIPNSRYVWTLWKELRKNPKSLELYYDFEGRRFTIEEFNPTHNAGALTWGGIGIIKK